MKNIKIALIALLLLIVSAFLILLISNGNTFNYNSAKGGSISLEPCPQADDTSNFTISLFESIKNSDNFGIGEVVDLGFYKVLIKNIEIKNEYLDPFTNTTVKTECPNAIVSFEIEKINLSESKEAVNPIFLSVGKESPPRVDLFVIFEGGIGGCQVIEGQLGMDDNAPIGTKVSGKCKITFRPDWGNEGYLVIELYTIKTGISLLVPITTSERQTLKYYKLRIK